MRVTSAILREMNPKITRAFIAFVLAVAAGITGYRAHGDTVHTPVIPAQTVTAPVPGTVRVVYSLDQKQNDKEIIALVEGAHKYIYFAIYEFTLKDVADALVAAKGRGVEVKGVVDSGESSNSYDRPIIEELQHAGISVVTEKHPSASGIMHIKAIVTDTSYAIGSYNWTNSATTINDEILEIGTDPALRQAYENVLLKLLEAYKGNTAAASAAAPISIGTIDYTEASKHIGETASVRGTLIEAYTSKSGTVFLDFCKSYKDCPFSGVIFADDVKKFKNLFDYAGSLVTISGKISSYQGQAEIVLSDPSQLSN